jgi:hypothetical protein
VPNLLYEGGSRSAGVQFYEGVYPYPKLPQAAHAAVPLVTLVPQMDQVEHTGGRGVGGTAMIDTGLLSVCAVTSARPGGDAGAVRRGVRVVAGAECADNVAPSWSQPAAGRLDHGRV